MAAIIGLMPRERGRTLTEITFVEKLEGFVFDILRINLNLIHKD